MASNFLRQRAKEAKPFTSIDQVVKLARTGGSKFYGWVGGKLIEAYPGGRVIVYEGYLLKEEGSNDIPR